MAENDPNGEKEKKGLSFKDKLKLFKSFEKEENENVYETLDNKNRTTQSPYSKLVPKRTDSDVETEAERPPPLPPKPHMAKLESKSSSDRGSVKSDYVGSDEYRGGSTPQSDLFIPPVLQKSGQAESEAKLDSKSSSDRSNVKSDYVGSDEYRGGSTPPSNLFIPPIPPKSGQAESEIPPLPRKPHMTQPPEGMSNIRNVMSSSERSDNSDYKGSDEYRGSSHDLMFPDTRINQQPQQHEKSYHQMSEKNILSQSSSKTHQSKPLLVPRAGNLSSDLPPNIEPITPSLPQVGVKPQEEKEMFSTITREIPRGHGAPSQHNYSSRQGGLKNQEGYRYPGVGHGGHLHDDNMGMHYGIQPPLHHTSEQPLYGPGPPPLHHTSEQPLYGPWPSPLHYTSEQPLYGPGPPPLHHTGEQPLYGPGSPQLHHTTDQLSYGEGPPLPHHTSDQLPYGPHPFPGHQQPGFQFGPQQRSPDHQYPVRSSYGHQMPHAPFYPAPVWQHGQIFYPMDGRQSPDLQHLYGPRFSNVHNPHVGPHNLQPNDERSHSPHTATHRPPSDKSRLPDQPTKKPNLQKKAEDKHVDMDEFRSDIINKLVNEMGYQRNHVKKVVERICSGEGINRQSQDVIIGDVVEMLDKEQQSTAKKTEVNRVPEKIESKTVSKGRQSKKKENPIKDEGNKTTHICIRGLDEEDLDDSTQREKFCNFLDKLVKEDVDRSSLFHGGDKLAIVAFLGDTDVGFLSRELKKKNYEGLYLEVCKVEPPTSITVSGVSDSISDRDVENYFKDQHKSGGGHVVSCEEDDGIYSVCFRSHTDVENVCQGIRRHRIGNNTLYVSPRFECKFGTVWDYRKHKVALPTQITVTSIDPHINNFILSSEPCFDEINQQLRSDFAQLCTFGIDSLCINCLLEQSTPNVRKLSKSWESKTRQKFDQLVASLLDKLEVKCTESVWESFKEQLKDIKNSNDSSEFMIVEDEENYSVVIVGMKFIVQSQHEELVHLKQKIETDLERASKIITETKKFQPGKVSLLEKDGVIIEVNNIAEDLKVITNTEIGEVQFTGIQEDINKAVIRIYEVLNEKIVTDVTGLSDQQMKLIKNDVIIGLIQGQLEDQNVKANIVVSGERIQVISSSGADNSSAIKIVKNFTKENVINRGEDAITVLSKPVWSEKVDEIKGDHKEKVLINVGTDGTVTLTTTGDIYHEVNRELKKVIDQHTIHSECIEVEEEGQYTFLLQFSLDDLELLQNDLKAESVQITLVKDGIEIRGTTSGIKTAKSKVNEKIAIIKEKKVEYEGPGIGYVLCHDNMERLQAIGEQTRTAILLEDLEDSGEDIQQASGIESFKCKNGITISLIVDDIANAKADVLVCTTSNDLNLSSGKACRSLLNSAGGDTLQRNCNSKYPHGVKEGEIASVKAGKLHCKKVYFGAFPEWKSGENQPLTIVFKFMQDCLTKAEKSGYTSIVFLALGTGALGYPANHVAELMYSCISDFDKKHQKCKVKTVGFVIHHKDNTTLQAFKAEEGKVKSGVDHVGIKCKNGTQIQLVTGELAKQEGDVIVCGTSQDLNLSSGKACGNLLHVGGQDLQKDCKKNYPQGIEPGQIAAVKGGKLKCQEVYFGLLPEWKTEQSKYHKTLWKFVETCMLKAHETGYSAIVFPALGTGALGYPAERAAHLMFDSVIKFDNCHDRSPLKNVKFVLYHKDQQTIKGFQQKEKEILKSSRPGAHGTWGRRQSKVKTKAAIGPIEKQKVDVIICCTGPNLNLSNGKTTQALVNVGGASLQKECGKKYSSGIQCEDLADIGGGNLPCKRVYLGVLPKYVTDKKKAEQVLHNFVSKCLYTVSKAGYHSIAIPAVGTGKYNQYPHHVVASVIFQAVDKFDRKNAVTSLKEVRCVSVSNDKKSCQAFKLEERKHYVPSVTRATVTRRRFYQGSRHQTSQSAGRTDKVSLFLYSDSDENIQKASHKIDEYCKSKITENFIKDEMIQYLPREEQLAIEHLADDHPIRVQINKQRNEIKVEGRTEDILNVKDVINRILSDFERDRHSEGEARILAEKIQWHFKERQTDRVKLIPYSSKINLKLERAFKDNKKVGEFLSDDGKMHKVDFKQMHEYPEQNPSDRVDVVRREKIAGSTFPLPKEWDDMGDTEQFKEVTLKSSSKEYKEVEKCFKDSVFQGKYQGSYSQSTFSVAKIIRIQNKYLYQQFEAKKNQLDHQNPPNTKNEQILWHGTGSAAISSINYNGFNRSYCASANDM